jgi:beta-lactam-binding protein with PASTA domain
VLEAIDRKALSPDPAARYPTADAMADALEAFLDEGAPRPAAAPVVGAAAVGAAAGVAATAARPYPPDAYAATPPPAGPEYDDADEPSGTSPWVWVAGLLGLAVLVVVGFLVFRLLSANGPETTPGPGTVTLPSFIDQTFDNALATADQLEIILEPTAVQRTDKEDGTIVSQDPAAGMEVERGSTVRVEVVSWRENVEVPQLTGLTEAEAIALILESNLTPGVVTREFDEAIPEGSVIGTTIPAGTQVITGTAIDYEVSRGPEPTPSPTPSPTPTPPPTPEPTPTPRPTVTVENYVGLTVQQATVKANGQGLDVRFNPSGAPADWVVVDQQPAAGESVPVGTNLRLAVVAPTTPTPEPTPEPTPTPAP